MSQWTQEWPESSGAPLGERPAAGSGAPRRLGRGTSVRGSLRHALWYPAALAPVAVLHLFAISVVSTLAVGRALLVATVVGVIVVAAVTAIVRERRRSAVAATLLVAILAFIPSVVAVLLAIAAGIIAFAAADRRSSAGDRLWTMAERSCLAGTTVLVLAVTIELVTVGGPARILDDLAGEGPTRDDKPAVTPTKSDPDVFLFILDGYPRADVLLEKTGFNNAPFLRALERLGFDVAAESRSSYVLTQLTLTSLMQMQHLDDIPGVRSALDDPWAFQWALRRNLVDSAGQRAFEALGYETVSVSAGYEPTAMRRVDRFLDAMAPNEFEFAALSASGLGAVVELLVPDLMDSAYRARLVETLAIVMSEVERGAPRPRLLVAHFPAPHQPFAYDSRGDGLSIDWLSNPVSGFSYREDRDAKLRALTEYIQWTNFALLPILDETVARHPDAIVIVMSDHGTDIDFRWDDLRWAEVGAVDARERVANLFASRTPRWPGLFGDDPVTSNVLPTILNAGFDLGVPLVADHSVLQRSDDPSIHVRIDASDVDR